MGTRYVVREIEIETNGDRLELLMKTQRSTIYDDITDFVAATDARRAALVAEGMEEAMQMREANILILCGRGRSVALSTSTLED